jgi:hypothetical protein
MMKRIWAQLPVEWATCFDNQNIHGIVTSKQPTTREPGPLSTENTPIQPLKVMIRMVGR